MSSTDKNSKQNQDLLKIKDKYYKLLDDYKQLTDDCNILRDEKTLIQLEKKQLMIDFKRNQEDIKKMNEDYNKLKEENDKLLKDMEILKNSNNTQQTTKVTILKNTNNNIIISKSDKKDLDIATEDNPTNKSLTLQNIKHLDFGLDGVENKKDDKQKLSDIKSYIYDMNNINDIINKIKNSNLGNDAMNNNNNMNNIEKSEVSVTVITNDNDRKFTEQDNKESIDMKDNQRIPPNKLNKSIEVSDYIKEINKNKQNKAENIDDADVNIDNENINVIDKNIEDNENIVIMLDNKELN